MPNHEARRRQRVRASSFVAVLAVLAGCAAPASDCAPGNWLACDIRDPACEQRILAAVQCDRGHELDEVPTVRRITQEELRAELVAEAATRPPRPAWDAAMIMLGLVPEGATSDDAAIESTVQNALATYSDETETITIVDRGAPMDAETDTRTFAHELVHAIQDRRYDLDAFTADATTVDALDARRSVAEGDAQFFALIYAARQESQFPERLAWDDFYVQWHESLLEAVRAAPAPFALARAAFPYWLGARVITSRWRASGSALFDSQSPAFVDAMYEAPPEGVSALIDPSLEGMEATLGCDAPAPPPGYEVATDSALGPLGVIAFLGATPSVETWDAASSVRADGIRVVNDGTHTAVVWRIRMAASPERFLRIARVEEWAGVSHHLVAVDGNDVVLVASDDAAVTTSWMTAVAHCP